MPKLLWEVKTLMCDICRERLLKRTVEVSKGVWRGVCAECDLNKDKENKDGK